MLPSFPTNLRGSYHLSASDRFDEVCAEFGVLSQRRHAVVADGAANVKKAMRDNILYIHCTIHCLQLCIGVSLLACQFLFLLSICDLSVAQLWQLEQYSLITNYS